MHGELFLLYWKRGDPGGCVIVCMHQWVCNCMYAPGGYVVIYMHQVGMLFYVCTRWDGGCAIVIAWVINLPVKHLGEASNKINWALGRVGRPN